MIKFAKKVYKKLVIEKKEEKNYNKWIVKKEQEAVEREKKNKLPTDVMFSIVIPLFRTPENFLSELIESIQQQTYENWELLLSDGSGNDELKEYLEKNCTDDRIRVLRRDTPLNISENTNCALKKVQGDYIVFADHDDLLPSYALYECARVIYENAMPDLIYSDEDKISMDGRKYFQPHFKPDYNLELLRSMNYFCHLVVVKKELQQKVGLLRAEYNGAQDYDFVLRCVEQANHIYHIPEVLYHWRSHAGSIAGGGDNKEYAFEAGRQALLAHYERCNIKAEVEKDTIFGIYHTHYQLKNSPMVLVAENQSSTLDSLLKKGLYEKYEIVENKKLNEAQGEYILFLDNRVQHVTTGWLRTLVENIIQNDVGIVGTKIVDNHKNYIHAGVVLGGKKVINYVADKNVKTEVGYMGRYICGQEYSAVSGLCMLISKKIFDTVGGFDERLNGELKYTDLCLKVRKAGYQVAYTPECEIEAIRPEKQTLQEKEYFCEKWESFLKEGDPYYNKNMGTDELFVLKREDNQSS